MIAENRILWLPDTDQRMWDEDASNRSVSGIRITPENALSVSVVYACIRVLAESVAALPLHILERVEGKGKRKAVELPLYRKLYLQPNSWQTSFEWRCQLMLHLGLYNVAYCEIIAGPAGAVDSLEPLHPSRMKVERIENGRLRYKYREPNGQETIYTQDQILAIRGLSEDGINGLSPVETCKDAIALARACEIHGSKFFANGARPGFVLSTDTQLNPEARENIRSQWDRRHGGVGNAFQTAVLTGGLKPYEIPQSSNSDAQFLELRKFQIEEICRLYRVPQHKVQSMQGQSYGSLEQVSQDFLTDTIVPWLRRFESAFLRDLIVEDDRYEVAFDTRAMLRADAASRTSMYTSLWNLGVYNTNDIRESEGLNAVEGGDIRYRPLNMGVLGQESAPADATAQQQPGSAIDGQAVAPAAAAPAEAAAGPQVADVSLNGAQINGLIAILSQVPAGLLSKDGAGALILASFPSIPPASVAAILNGVSTTPLPAEPPKAAQAAPAQRAYCKGGKGAGIDPTCSGKGNVSADSGGLTGGGKAGSLTNSSDVGEAQVKSFADDKDGGATADPELGGALVPEIPYEIGKMHNEARGILEKDLGKISSDEGYVRENSSTSVAQLRADAEEVAPAFKEMLDKAAAGRGETNFGPDSCCMLKTESSLEDKVQKYMKEEGISREEAIASVPDSVRGTIVLENTKDIGDTARALQEQVHANGGTVEFDNKFLSTKEDGYTAVHATVKMPTRGGGTVSSEIQLHLRSVHDGTMRSLKERSHKLYKMGKTLSGRLKQRAKAAQQLLFTTGLAYATGLLP